MQYYFPFNRAFNRERRLLWGWKEEKERIRKDKKEWNTHEHYKKQRNFMLQPLKDILCVPSRTECEGVLSFGLQIHLGLFIVLFSCFVPAEFRKKESFYDFSLAKENSGKFNTFCALLMLCGRERRVMLRTTWALGAFTRPRWRKFEVKIEFKNRKY